MCSKTYSDIKLSNEILRSAKSLGMLLSPCKLDTALKLLFIVIRQEKNDEAIKKKSNNCHCLQMA